MGAQLDIKEQQLYTDNYFRVADMNNDGVPEILFTRASFLAEGAKFQAFTWTGQTYKPIALVENKVRLEDRDKDGTKEIVEGYDYKGRKLQSPTLYKWSGKTYKIAAAHTEGRTKVSTRTVLFIAMLATIGIIGLMLSPGKGHVSPTDKHNKKGPI